MLRTGSEFCIFSGWLVTGSHRRTQGQGDRKWAVPRGCGLATLLALSPQIATPPPPLPIQKQRAKESWKKTKQNCVTLNMSLNLSWFLLENEVNNTQLSEDARVEIEKHVKGFFHDRIITEMKWVLYLSCCIQGDGREGLCFQFYGHQLNDYSVTVTAFRHVETVGL